MTKSLDTNTAWRKWLFTACRYSLAIGCLIYALWGVDINALANSLLQFSPVAIIGLVIFSLLCVLPAALRLGFLTKGRTNLWQSSKVILIALALNNVLPAKAGELAKIVYLKTKIKIPAGECLEIVFWERFSDLNALLLIGGASAFFMGNATAMYPLGFFVFGVWSFIFLDRRLPAVSTFCLKLIPLPKVSAMFRDLLSILRTRSNFKFYLILALTTAFAWAMYVVMVLLTLELSSGIDITTGQAVAVFAVAMLSYVIPSSPGSIGVYEAAFVLSLGWFGVPKETAFAAGFVCHAIQLIPSTAIGLVMVALNNSSIHTTDATAPTS